MRWYLSAILPTLIACSITFSCQSQSDPRWTLVRPGIVQGPLDDVIRAAAVRIAVDGRVRDLAHESSLHLAFEERQHELIQGQRKEIERLHEAMDLADHTIEAREKEAQAWKKAANASKNSLWWKLPLAGLIGYGIANALK